MSKDYPAIAAVAGMSQGARAVRELAAEIARLQRYDANMARYLADPQPTANISPATHVTTPDSSLARWRRAGTAACNQLRFFFRRLRWWRP